MAIGMDDTESAYSTCFGKPGAICSLPKQRRTFRADFVLVREEVRGVGSGSDWRNVLYGLMFAGVPSVNSLESIIMFGERPLAYGRLLQIRKELGVCIAAGLNDDFFASVCVD